MKLMIDVLFQITINVSINRKETLEKISSFFKKHKPSWALFTDVLDLINSTVQETIVPKSKYLFIKEFSKETSSPTYHIECKFCYRIGFRLDTSLARPKDFVCQKCTKVNDYSGSHVSFVTFDLEPQIEKLLALNKESITFPESRNTIFPLKDIFDGKLHQNVAEKVGPFLSILLNTDGLSVHKSSKNSIWPIIYSLNNICPEKRFKPENLMLAGVFFGSKLDMKEFLFDFTEDIERINHKKGGMLTPIGKIPLYCISSAADSPAKAKMLNMKSHSAYQSCPYCKEFGVYIDGAVRFCSWYVINVHYFKHCT